MHLGKLSEHDLIMFLLGLVIMLISAIIMGTISEKLRLTKLIGQLLAGVILGPTVLGTIFPHIGEILYETGRNFRILDAIFNLSTIMLLFVAGLEIKTSLILKYIKPVIWVNLFGTIIPFICGFALAWYQPQIFLQTQVNLVFSLFIGTALSISALPVIATILTDTNIIKTKVGGIILTSAMLTDIIGWMLFSSIIKLHKSETIGLSFLKTVGLHLCILFVVAYLVSLLANRCIPWIKQKQSRARSMLPLSICAALLAAAFSQFIELHASLGAFIAGIVFSKLLDTNEEAKQSIEEFVVNFFTPLFFVSIGLKTNFINDFNLATTLLLILIACFSKIIGASLGALVGGLNKFEALVVGCGMNARGAMEIILSSLALSYGIISPTLFVSFVIMALVTSMISMPALAILKPRIT